VKYIIIYEIDKMIDGRTVTSIESNCDKKRASELINFINENLKEKPEMVRGCE
jgi:hypothetical protein